MLWFGDPRSGSKKENGAGAASGETGFAQDSTNAITSIRQTGNARIDTASDNTEAPANDQANEQANDQANGQTGEPSITPATDPLHTGPAGVAPQHPAQAVERRPVGRLRTGGVALALGGGVARGWAHIGVLKAVDDFGLPISMIAGTSIGALVGGCYLAGKLDELEEFALSLTRTSIVRYLDFSLRGSGLMTGSRLARRLEEHMSTVNMEDLSRPFVAVATDIQSGHEIWLHDGPLVPALRASYALPGVFSPIMHGGRQLVDGALVNPVPVSVCRAFEPDIVIAINLNTEAIGRGTVIRASHYDRMEDAMRREAEASGSWFPSFLQSAKRETPTQNRLGVTAVMVESFNIIQDRIARARLAGDPPDYTIRPRLRDVGLIDFHKAGKAIELGYDEMMVRLRELENQGALGDLVSRPAGGEQSQVPA